MNNSRNDVADGSAYVQCLRSQSGVVWGLLVMLALLAAGPVRGLSAQTLQLKDGAYGVLKAAKTDRYWVRLDLLPAANAQAIGDFEVVLAADPAKGSYYRFVSGEAGWRFDRVLSGKGATLARGAERLTGRKALDLRFWRGDEFVLIVVDGRSVGEILDGTLRHGNVGMRGAVQVKRILCQGVPELRFHDDFMRDAANQQLAPWEKVRGKARFHSVREDADTVDVQALAEARRPDYSRSPNPFSFEVTAEKPGDWALLKTGYWFWTDYDLGVSARCTDGVWGVVFNYKSDEDYYLVRWPLTNTVMGKTRIELRHVKGKERKLLSSAWVMGQRDQWYRIGVQTLGRRVRISLDHATIMDLMDPESCGGGIGLYVEGTNPVALDDVDLVPVTRLDLDAESWIKQYASFDGKWGEFRNARTAYPDNMGIACYSPAGSALFGNEGWKRYEVKVDAPIPVGDQKIGVKVGMDAAGNGYEVDLRTGARGIVEVVQLANGGAKRTVLASCDDVDFLGGDTVAVRVDGTRPNEMRIYIDDTLVLRSLIPSAVAGRAGLTVAELPNARFRNLKILFQREEDAERAPKVIVFTQDPYMKLWSSPEGNWWPDKSKPNTYWHNGDFYGRSEITLPVKPGLMLIHAASMISEKGGYALVQRTVVGNKVNIQLLRLGQKVAEATVKMPPPPPEAPAAGAAAPAAPAPAKPNPEAAVIINKDGRYLWLTQDGKDLFVYRDTAPLASHRLAVTDDEPITLGDIAIRRFNVVDYYFEESPSDWHRIGKWEVTNRFVCDPRWSHMAGVTTAAGILLNKLRFDGDLTMEAYMGMRMRRDSRYPRSYPRVGDFNLAMATDGSRLDSGYNFILQGWDPAWSESTSWLLKQGKRVAEGRRQLLPAMRNSSRNARIIPVPWILAGRPVHGAWYYIKSRRHGKNFELYVDSEPVYQFRDPDPIPGGNVGIFTYDAWVVVARVKLSYTHKIIPGRLVPAPAHAPVEVAMANAWPVVVSETHPGVSFDFEQSTQGWESTGEEQGADLSLDTDHAGTGRHSLRISNIEAGGDFGAKVALNGQSIDPLRIATLSFDYRIPPDVKVNLYFTMGSVQAFLHMTGPSESDATRYRLGDLDIQADGKWHHASFPLSAAVLSWRKDSPGVISGITFGNDHAGYLQAGIGGNPTGASYNLDNFRMIGVGGPAFTYQVNASPGATMDTVRPVIDQRPDTVPTKPPGQAPGQLANGLWYCHANYVTPDGKTTETVHLPFIVAARGPAVAASNPKSGDAWACGPVVLDISENAGVGPNPHLTAVKVNGTQVPPEQLDATYDWATHRLSVDWNRSHVQASNGAQVALDVTLADVQGNTSTWQAKFKADLSRDKTPPSAVALHRRYITDDFESGVGEWQGGASSYLMRDDATAARGKWSLKITNPILGGTFFTYAVTSPFDARKFPILEFDYKIHDGVRTDAVLSGSGTAYSFGFTDNAGYGRFLGSIPDVKNDDKWHHAEVGLLAALRNQPYRQRMFAVDWLGFLDSGYTANGPGASYHIDDLRLVPLISGARPLELAWTATDVSGIKGYSYLWSTKPADEPDAKIDSVSGSAEFKQLPPGTDVYFHVRACDNAGNWGPTSHYRFFVDRTPPVIATPSPGPGARSASSRIRIPMSDAESGVAPDSLTVTIDGRKFQPGREGVTFDVAKSLFVWDWIAGHAKDQTSIANGAAVTVEVTAKDFAGNPAKSLKWTWTMDHSKDREPPLILDISSATQRQLVRDDFQSNVGLWQNGRPSSAVHGAAVARVLRDRATSDYCISLTLAAANGYYDASAYAKPYSAADYPLIAFEYAIPANVKVDLVLHTNMGWVSVKMSAPKPYGKLVGTMKPFTADGTWRFAWVDVYDLLCKAYPQRTKLPKAKQFTISKVFLADRARSGNAAGSVYYIDNFQICDYGTPDAKFQWSALDITGILGYAFAIDETPGTQVTAKIVTTKPEAALQMKAQGLNYFHLRAKDNGGNWSRTYHLPYFRRGAEVLLPDQPGKGGK